MSNLSKHLKTIMTHRRYVRKACFNMGIFWQGLIHDLSKYTLTELSICKYYSGKGSPHQVCRDTIGYSPSWIHHYHINKHHHMFWLDEQETGEIIPMKMPYKYVIESFCDMVGAGKAYEKACWTTQSPLTYWNLKCEGKRIMHPESAELVRYLLTKMSQCKDEADFYDWYKTFKVDLKNAYIKGYDR